MSVRILIVEDELIIAEDIKEKIEGFGYIAVEVADNFDDAMNAIEKQNPDLILLDIGLKGSLSGIDIAKEIDLKYSIPYIFLTSNHDSKTLEIVKTVHPSSYLMKPYKKEELYMSIELAFQQKQSHEINEKEIIDHIFIKEGHTYQKINIKDIKYLKSEGVYIEIHAPDKRYITRDSFKNILLKLPANTFIQTHKSYYINIKHISSVTAMSIFIGKDEIPLGRTFKEEVHKKLGIHE